MRDSNLDLHGIDEPLEEEIILRSGPFEAVFEPSRAYLRELRIRGVVAVRNVYVHVRRSDWGTIVPTVTMIDRKIGRDRFQLTWKGVHREGEIDFEWIGTLSGTPSSVHYSCDGEALTSFRTNRTSLCVLIPREFRGFDAEIEHSDGSKTSLVMPVNIAPQQPLKTMHSLTIGPAILTFEGAEFDAEDQRNWTDASFKAYPANSVLPATGLKKGDRITQSVRIEESSWNSSARPKIDTDLGNSVRPKLGATVSNDQCDLAGLCVDFLRVEMPSDLQKAGHLLDHARSAGLPLQVVIPKGAIIPELRSNEVVTLIDASMPLNGMSSAWLGGGDFVSFNMGRHSAVGFSGIEVNGTPQIHTFDERSILDNAATLHDVARSLSSIAPGVNIGLNIRMETEGTDPRLESMFGSVWLMRCLAALWGCGSACLTLGTVEELRFPLLALLTKELTEQTNFKFNEKSFNDDVVFLQRDPILAGNLRRTSRVVQFKGDVKEAHFLTAKGWKPCRFKSGMKLGPYQIVRLRLNAPNQSN